MIQEISKNIEYIKIKDAADIIAKSERSIRRYCKNGKYKYRIVNGNGGQQYEILVSSLEPEIQEKILCTNTIDDSNMFNSKLEDVVSSKGAYLPYSEGNSYLSNVSPLSLSSEPQILSTKGENISPEIKNALISFGLYNNSDERVIPEAAKKKALYKVDLLVKWTNFRKNAKIKSKADKDFIKLYNSKLLDAFLYEKIGKISIQTLYRWNKDYADRDWRNLVDGYNYGCESRLNTSLSHIEKYILLKYMLHQNQFKLSKAYEFICFELRKIGFENISSEASFRRVWNFVLTNYGDFVEISRCGIKAALDKQLPHITRDLEVTNVGDVIVGDGHTLDFEVADPITGKPVRPTLVAFLDVASRNFVGYDIMVTENTQVIASALRNSIINLGKYPKVVQLDNGRAFKGKTFTGDSIDFTNAGIQGLYSKLGIQTHFCKPYNARSKTIERAFKEFTESLAKLMPSYIGNNIENKPANRHRNEKFHQTIKSDYIPTIEDTKSIINEWLNDIYRQRPCMNNKTQTIGEYFNAGCGLGVDVDKLDDLMMTSEVRQTRKCEVRLFNNWYYTPALAGINRKVEVRYNMFDLSYVKIYSLKGEYIGKAERVIAVHPFAELLGTPNDVATYKRAQKENKKIINTRINTAKKVLKGLYPQKNGCSISKIIEIKKEIKEIQQIEETAYEINYAENINILNDTEKENIYEIDYSKKIIEDRQYNI